MDYASIQMFSSKYFFIYNRNIRRNNNQNFIELTGVNFLLDKELILSYL